MNIDYEALRKDLEEYFMGAMFNVSGAAMIDLQEVENASDEELIEIARDNGFNLNDYKVGSRRRLF